MFVAADLSAAKLAFFGMAATVLPVFMLAISLQFRVQRVFGRGLGLRLDSARQRAVALVIAYSMVVLMAAGEIIPIGALYYDSNQGHKSAYVFAALAIETLFMFIGTVDGVVTQLRCAIGTKTATSQPKGFASPSTVQQPRRGLCQPSTMRREMV